MAQSVNVQKLGYCSEILSKKYYLKSEDHSPVLPSNIWVRTNGGEKKF